MKDLFVIELASVLAGPSVGMFLAEQGATVIKIENIRTGGDVTRTWKLPSESQETDVSAYFSSVNWGKQSLALDLRKPAAKEIVYRLLQKADVVLTSYRPGSAEKLGMDAATLMTQNPQLIVAEVNGYGPKEKRAAYDAIIQAEAGFTFLNGEKGKGLSKMPVALMDVLAAHHLKEAVLLAYIERLKTGKGSRVSISLLEAGISSLVNQATNFLVAGKTPQPQGSAHPNIAPYGTVYLSADQKPIIFAIGNDKQFAALFDILDIKMQDQFVTNFSRVQNRDDLDQLLIQYISKKKQSEILELCKLKTIPAGGVSDMKEVFGTSQAQRLLLKSGSLKGVRGYAARHDRAAISLSPPPRLSQHRDAILRERLGMNPTEIETLIGDEVVG